jgi:uncharacterized membrane protein YgdD (TMEM256/DUF423 family)
MGKPFEHRRIGSAYMTRSSKFFLTAACLLLLTGVQLGALGAHALNDVLTPQKLTSWGLAVQYQLVHGLGLILLVLLWDKLPASKLLLWAASLMLLGVFLFSGSIYTSAIGLDMASQIAPLGGGSFMLAWLLVAIAVLRS